MASGEDPGGGGDGAEGAFEESKPLALMRGGSLLVEEDPALAIIGGARLAVVAV